MTLGMDAWKLPNYRVFKDVGQETARQRQAVSRAIALRHNVTRVSFWNNQRSIT
jgi:hypothetical protein